jgi:ubiquinone/menaquinone biosynthesis C-methylase UbiE
MMDYDKTAMAATYDAARSYRPEVLTLWLDLVAAHIPPDPAVIVDVGCGTGRFTHPLAARFPQARVVGVDPSEQMLQHARSKQVSERVELWQAGAEHLPLDDGSADLVFMSMMLHHINDGPRAAGECRRVLRGDGRLCIRNSTRDSIYPQRIFFRGFQEIVDTQLPSRDEVVGLFERAGLRLDAYQLIRHPLAGNWQELADKLALRADSFLARLPDADFQAGMAALRAHAAHSDPQERITEQLHFFVFGL